jgi:hypothetical protein
MQKYQTNFLFVSKQRYILQSNSSNKNNNKNFNITQKNQLKIIIKKMK